MVGSVLMKEEIKCGSIITWDFGKSPFTIYDNTSRGLIQFSRLYKISEIFSFTPPNARPTLCLSTTYVLVWEANHF